MVTSVYVHRDYVTEVCPPDELSRALGCLPKDHLYDVVKYNRADGSFSFIHSPDFDESPEPIVGKAIKVSREGKLTVTPQKRDPQIYHHKWQMVGDDYHGFDVAESKARSCHWQRVYAGDRCRIGWKSYWDRVVIPLLDGRTGK
jgi:hypothetical protein